MNITNLIVLAVLTAILAPVLVYLHRAKKRGVHCIGCPSGTKCSGGCAGCSGGCHHEV